METSCIRTNDAPVGDRLLGYGARGDDVGGSVAGDQVAGEVFCEEKGGEETELAGG